MSRESSTTMGPHSRSLETRSAILRELSDGAPAIAQIRIELRRLHRPKGGYFSVFRRFNRNHLSASLFARLLAQVVLNNRRRNARQERHDRKLCCPSK